MIENGGMLVHFRKSCILYGGETVPTELFYVETIVGDLVTVRRIS